MDYSQKISERQWNLPEKGELESRREATYIDDIIQKDHIQRKLLEHLDGINTVFDGGAGSGRFSILFDSNPYVCGMGKDNLLAIGEIDCMDSELRKKAVIHQTAGTASTILTE